LAFGFIRDMERIHSPIDRIVVFFCIGMRMRDRDRIFIDTFLDFASFYSVFSVDIAVGLVSGDRCRDWVDPVGTAGRMISGLFW
jgi:hypothetical protein